MSANTLKRIIGAAVLFVLAFFFALQSNAATLHGNSRGELVFGLVCLALFVFCGALLATLKPSAAPQPQQLRSQQPTAAVSSR